MYAGNHPAAVSLSINQILILKSDAERENMRVVTNP
jgi:hypothetical protein